MEANNVTPFGRFIPYDLATPADSRNRKTENPLQIVGDQDFAEVTSTYRGTKTCRLGGKFYIFEILLSGSLALHEINVTVGTIMVAKVFCPCRQNVKVSGVLKLPDFNCLPISSFETFARINKPLQMGETASVHRIAGRR